ncbi:hypothetical protein SAMN06265221_1314 [Paracoccus laeviglucosivorans]|uniref:Uncharacterized protein n=2 Tax=Paracoccus laeviglucosivorans TaxID=1197861 RepID=A0A521FNQ4_9RHOB|nr:hypothetical protein SAMN06265221_1314 [Paracoccus laeviglucosivorans]
MDDAGTVAVAGWTTRPRPELRLHVNDIVLDPVLVTRHVRRDLRSSEPLGVIALFDLSDLLASFDPDDCTIHLAEMQDFTEIQGNRLSGDAHRLVEIGVDETFFALLRLIAGRHVLLSDEKTGRDICARLRPTQSAGRETENHVLAVDRCQSTAAGQGALVGWFMPAAASTEQLCALAIEDEMVVPVDLLPGTMVRADLAAYAPRYRFTGRDGYGGGWRFPRPPSGPVRLLLMIPGENFAPGVIVSAEQVEPADLAQNLTTATLGIDDIDARARLRRAMLPDRLPDPQPTDKDAAIVPMTGDTLLVLDHDLSDHDLRDVLRRIGPHLPGRLRLHLLRPRLSTVLRNGIEGAAREVATGLTYQSAALTITAPPQMPARVVFARSATLFQFDPAQLFALQPTEPRVMLLDPIGTVMATPAAQADRFARDLLPFALSMDGPAFFAMLDQIPQCFLTEEARIRLLVEQLMVQDDAALSRVDAYRYFEGKTGPHCQSFADGRDWHAFDAESRRAILEAAL